MAVDVVAAAAMEVDYCFVVVAAMVVDYCFVVDATEECLNFVD